MKMKSIKYILAILMIAVILYFLGGFLGKTCAQIDECQACWKTVNTKIESELCSTSPCVAEPYQQQRNAVVDVLLCACSKAENEGYTNTELNEKIENLHNLYFANANVNQICTGNTDMSKVSYS